MEVTINDSSLLQGQEWHGFPHQVTSHTNTKPFIKDSFSYMLIVKIADIVLHFGNLKFSAFTCDSNKLLVPGHLCTIVLMHLSEPLLYQITLVGVSQNINNSRSFKSFCCNFFTQS